MSTQYETVCVLKPDVQGDKLVAFETKVKKVLADQKVENLVKHDWGIRKLAYPILKLTTGWYLSFTYTGEGNVVAELERQLGYDDNVLRALTMKLGKDARPTIKADAYHFGKTEEPAGFGGGWNRDRNDRRPRFDRGNDRGFDRSGEKAPEAAGSSAE